MSPTQTSASKNSSLIGVAIGCLICVGLATAFLTDLPSRMGIGSPQLAEADRGDHDHSDHDRSDHDEDAHDDHSGDGHDDHSEHDHAVDHQHSGHDDHSAHDDHAGHDHGDESADEASMPPFMLGDESTTDTSMTAIDDHAGHDHSSHDDHAAHDDHDHAAHDDDHEGHSDETSIALSPQARKNLRITVRPATLGKFTQYVDVPGVITDWPGQTHIDVTSPLTGVISAIKVARGQLVANSTPLFSLRLTHQDLVKTQEQFLAQLGQRDVEEREIQRLSSIASSGAVAGKTLINRKYERDMLLATLRAARQSLLLHGLTDQQITQIERDRELVREVTVDAPELHADDSLHHDSQRDHVWQSSPTVNVRLAGHRGDGTDNHDHAGGQTHAHDHAHDDVTSPRSPQSEQDRHSHVDVEFLVTSLDVNRGQSVEAGERLTRLSDYSRVLIEGQAFQQDSELLRRAAKQDLPLQAVLDTARGEADLIEGLRIVNIGSEINRLSRALPFYVSLDNEVERSEQRGDKHYASWKYKPGQRLKLRLPSSNLDDVFVVPADAVAQEGPERFVFVQNGDHFDRVSVHVRAEDSQNVAIANDGQIRKGNTIVTRGAHQLQMAMKNKSGGAIDPHAGHSH